MPCRNPALRLSWLWALLPILMATALIAPLLDVDAFNGDEPASLLAAGILRAGPWSIEEVWNNTAPRHAPGWPMLLSIWGRVVGWSEFASRALSLFIGLLTLAWVYRTGSDLFAPAAGLVAALLLSASVFHLAYMVRADPYALASLCAAICIWCYWRVALHQRSPRRGAQVGLLLGSISLLYSHYLGALLLPVLGLFHLLFVPKQRRWWRPVLLFGLAILVAALQIPLIIRGLTYTASEELGSRILTAPALLSHFLRFMTNGLVDPSPPFSELLLLTLPLALVIVTLQRLRRGKGVSAVRLLLFTSAVLLAMIIVIDEVFKVIVVNRIRYLIPLWPLAALLSAATLWRLSRKFRLLVAGVLTLWLVLGAWLTVATDFRYEQGYFFRSDLKRFYEILNEHVSTTDLLLVDFSVTKLNSGWFYARNLGIPREFIYRYKSDPYVDVRPVNADFSYLWLIYLSKDRVGFADLPHELERVFCERVLDEWGFTLERYALRSVENCPARPVRLTFDPGIQLNAPEITVKDGLLRLDAHFRSADEQLLARYSLAVHVIDQLGQRVAQGDTGVGPGAIVPLRSEIDVSALPPGDYELRVALYDWQTGARLTAHDPETDEVSDMHALQRFRID